MGMDKIYDVAVIGGGASGIMAAISAKLHGARYVALIEKNDRIGKKLLTTGNGRCNLSNLESSSTGYNGSSEFAKSVISKFDVGETVRFFEKNGLLTYSDDEGRVYPATNQASSVLDVLRLMCDRLKVDVLCGFDVRGISPEPDMFDIACADRSVCAKRVVIACAGKAAPATGSDGGMMKILKRMGYGLISVQPSLCPLKVDPRLTKPLKGVRARCIASLYKKGSLVFSDIGEVQFNEDNLSGIVIMQLSSKMRMDTQGYSVSLNLMGGHDRDKLMGIIYARKKNMGYLECEHLLDGIVNKKIAYCIIKRVGIEKLSLPIAKLGAGDINKICDMLCGLQFDIKGKANFDKAQVTSGGLDTAQFGQDMQSMLHKGLYACGEILDVDGLCGGYNLQWAWSSGYIAGKSAAQSI